MQGMPGSCATTSVRRCGALTCAAHILIDQLELALPVSNHRGTGVRRQSSLGECMRASRSTVLARHAEITTHSVQTGVAWHTARQCGSLMFSTTQAADIHTRLHLDTPLNRRAAQVPRCMTITHGHRSLCAASVGLRRYNKGRGIRPIGS